MFVNGKKLEPNCAFELTDGDEVQFGVKKCEEEAPEFLYKYHTKLKVCINVLIYFFVKMLFVNYNITD